MDDKIETGTREESDKSEGETWAAILKMHYTHISNF